MFFHLQNLKIENNNPWFKLWFIQCFTTQTINYLCHSRYWVFKALGIYIPLHLVGHQSVSISSGQRNLTKTYHNDANTSGITKFALKKFLDFFWQRRKTRKIAKIWLSKSFFYIKNCPNLYEKKIHWRISI